MSRSGPPPPPDSLKFPEVLILEAYVMLLRDHVSFSVPCVHNVSRVPDWLLVHCPSPAKVGQMSNLLHCVTALAR